MGSEAADPTWRSLGSLSFSANERSGFSAREMKSVVLPGPLARWVRLLFHGCHANARNQGGQVGLVHVGIQGQATDLSPEDSTHALRARRGTVAAATDDDDGATVPANADGGVGPPAITTSTSSPRPTQGVPAPRTTAPEGRAPAGRASDECPAPPSHSLVPATAPAKPVPPKADGTPARAAAPARYATVDPVTAARIAELQQLKAAAVQAEDYDEAKRLKAAVDRLCSFGALFPPWVGRHAGTCAQQVVVMVGAAPGRARPGSGRRRACQPGGQCAETYAGNKPSLPSEPWHPGARIAALESRKTAAVAEEDYDTAKEIKEEIEGLRRVSLRHSPPRDGGAASSPRTGGDDDMPSATAPLRRSLSGSWEQGERPRPDDKVAGLRASLAAATAQLDLGADAGAKAARPQHEHEREEDENQGPFIRAAGPDVHDTGPNRGASAGGQSAGHGSARVSPARRGREDQRARRRGQGDAAAGGRRDEATEAGAMDPGPPPPGFPGDLPAPEPLTPGGAKDAADALELLGPYAAACLLSKTWQLRAAALQVGGLGWGPPGNCFFCCGWAWVAVLAASKAWWCGSPHQPVPSTPPQFLEAGGGQSPPVLTVPANLVGAAGILVPALQDRVAAVFLAAIPALLSLATSQACLCVCVFGGGGVLGVGVGV